MSAPAALVEQDVWRTRPLATILRDVAEWIVLAAVLASLTLPRFAVGGIRVTIGDLLGAAAGGVWLLSVLLSPRRPVSLYAARWPAIILVVGVLHVVSAASPSAVVKGVVALGGLWLLPAAMLPNLLVTPRQVERVLLSVSAGTVGAAIMNLAQVARIGLESGVPVVWGPVDYYQGYFQALGLAVAAPRLMGAITAGRITTALAWAVAAGLNVSALLVTQTRGAWIVGVLVVVVLAVVWRRGVSLVILVAAGVSLLMTLSPEFAAVAWARVQSIFSLQARLTGFNSSVIRLALALTAVQMFLANPLLGVGLKNFVVALPAYAPPGMPLSVEMGLNQVLTPIEGPHSTYLALLAETGAVGALALVAWIAGAAWTQWGVLRRRADATPAERAIAASLLGGVVVVAGYNLFSEMNATGALPLVYMLVLASGVAVGTRSVRG